MLGSVATRVILSRLCGNIAAEEDELSVSSESVGLVGGVLVCREVGVCAGKGLSSVVRCLALGRAARPRLRRVFVVLCAAVFARGAVCL